MNKIVPIVIALCLGGSSALAQGAYTPVALRLMEERSLWTSSDNAAAFYFNPLPHFGSVGLSASRLDGEYRQAQQATASTVVAASAAGDATVGRINLIGDFAFRNIFDSGCKYNTNLYEVADDMPYYILDSNPSRWIRQEYEMQVKASAPLSENLAAGMIVHSTDKVGAKQKDPRSEPYVMDIDLRPSLALKLGGKHVIGLSGFFIYDYERAYPSNNNFRIDQKTACTLGLGEVNNSYVGGNNGLKEYYYNKYLYGGAIQYAFEGDLTVRTQIRALTGSTEVQHKKSLPESKGRTQTMRLDASALVLWGEKHSNRLDICGLYRYTDGIEKVQQLDKTAFNQKWVTIAENTMSSYNRVEAAAGYDHLFGLDGLSYDWSVGGKALFSMEDDAYFIPSSSYNWTRLGAEAYGAHNFKLKAGSLFVRAGAGYGKSLGGEYVYGGSKTDSQAINLYKEDIEFYTSDCAEAELSVVWSLMHRKAWFNLGLDAACKKSLTSDRVRMVAGLSFDVFF